MIPINKVQKGKAPTLLEAEKANELISAINSLLRMKVIRGEKDEFLVSNENSILTLKESGGSFDGNTIQAYICENGRAELKNIYIE